MEIKTELTIVMDLMVSQWETIKAEQPALNSYELSEAICLLAYVIKEVEK